MIKLCRSVGCLEVECQCTDEGEPWCVIYDRASDGVIVHLARIDRKYVIILPLQARSKTRATMAGIIEIALTEIAHSQTVVTRQTKFNAVTAIEVHQGQLSEHYEKTLNRRRSTC